MKNQARSITFTAKAGFLVLLALMATSCTSPRNVDYKNYVRMPSKPTTVVMRAALKSIPYTRERAFYGNYGGSGCLGGRPADEMDEYFRRHDVVYTIGKSRRTMRLADEELVHALKQLDTNTLSPDALEYRDRAIKFMESTAAEIVGKPLTSGLRIKEPKNSYFSDPESVHEFFKPTNPGILDLPSGGIQSVLVRGGTPDRLSMSLHNLEH